MTFMNIGDIIKARRLELKISQHDLCEGICEQATLSRIESGHRTPSKGNLEVLLERLGLPAEQYYALITSDNVRVEHLKQDVISANINRDYIRSLKAINELESITAENDFATRQFILRSKIVSGYEKNGKIISYTNIEVLNMLQEALYLTVPRFNFNQIEHSLLGFDEAKIINHIAVAYAALGERKKAIDIYRQLFRYSQNRYADTEKSSGIVTLVAYNYSKQLGCDGLYEDAIEVAEIGRQYCVKFGKARMLGQILCNLSCDLHEIGHDSEAKTKLYEGYYVLRAMGKETDYKAVEIYAKATFGITFD